MRGEARFLGGGRGRGGGGGRGSGSFETTTLGVDLGLNLCLNLGFNLGSLGGGKSAKGGGGMGKGRKGTASGSDAKGGAVACAAEVRVAGSVMVCVVSWTCERGGRWPARRLWCFVFNEFGVGMPCCCSTGRRRGHDRR